MNPLIPIIALCVRLEFENQALRGAAAAGAAKKLFKTHAIDRWGFRSQLWPGRKPCLY